MKTRKSFLAAIAIFTLFSLLGVAYNRRVVDASIKLNLVVTTPSRSYLLGEIIPLSFEIVNEADTEISLPGDLTIGEFIRVYLADSTGAFKEYRGPNSEFQIDGLYKDIKLKPKEAVKSQTFILWNSKPPSEYNGEMFAQNLLETDYTIPESGIYFVKVVFDTRGESSTRIESESIQIVINEPVGDDLKVWKKIKANGEFAYLMQKGDFKVSGPEKKRNLVKEAQQIITSYPNSRLANQMNRGLEIFRTNEVRKEGLKTYRR